MKALELKIPPLIVAALFAGAMWLAVIYWPWMTLEMPLHNITASILVVTGILIPLLGVKAFRKAKTTVNPMAPNETTAIVTSGIYRYTRNPMYAGFLLELAGLSFYFDHTIAYLLVPGYMLYMNRFQIEPEERILAEQFGSEYREYLQTVRRWL